MNIAPPPGSFVGATEEKTFLPQPAALTNLRRTKMNVALFAVEEPFTVT